MLKSVRNWFEQHWFISCMIVLLLGFLSYKIAIETRNPVPAHVFSVLVCLVSVYFIWYMVKKISFDKLSRRSFGKKAYHVTILMYGLFVVYTIPVISIMLLPEGKDDRIQEWLVSRNIDGIYHADNYSSGDTIYLSEDDFLVVNDDVVLTVDGIPEYYGSANFEGDFDADLHYYNFGDSTYEITGESVYCSLDGVDYPLPNENDGDDIKPNSDGMIEFAADNLPECPDSFTVVIDDVHYTYDGKIDVE